MKIQEVVQQDGAGKRINRRRRFSASWFQRRPEKGEGREATGEWVIRGPIGPCMLPGVN